MRLSLTRYDMYMTRSISVCAPHWTTCYFDDRGGICENSTHSKCVNNVRLHSNAGHPVNTGAACRKRIHPRRAASCKAWYLYGMVGTSPGALPWGNMVAPADFPCEWRKQQGVAGWAWKAVQPLAITHTITRQHWISLAAREAHMRTAAMTYTQHHSDSHIGFRASLLVVLVYCRGSPGIPDCYIRLTAGTIARSAKLASL